MAGFLARSARCAAFPSIATVAKWAHGIKQGTHSSVVCSGFSPDSLLTEGLTARPAPKCAAKVVKSFHLLVISGLVFSRAHRKRQEKAPYVKVASRRTPLHHSPAVASTHAPGQVLTPCSWLHITLAISFSSKTFFKIILLVRKNCGKAAVQGTTRTKPQGKNEQQEKVSARRFPVPRLCRGLCPQRTVANF